MAEHVVITRDLMDGSRFRSAAPDVTIVRAADADALADARVVLLDLRIDGMRGAPTIEALAQHAHGLVLYTSRERDGLVDRLLRAGATAHVCKSADLADLDAAFVTKAIGLLIS